MAVYVCLGVRLAMFVAFYVTSRLSRITLCLWRRSLLRTPIVNMGMLHWGSLYLYVCVYVYNNADIGCMLYLRNSICIGIQIPTTYNYKRKYVSN